MAYRTHAITFDASQAQRKLAVSPASEGCLEATKRFYSLTHIALLRMDCHEAMRIRGIIDNNMETLEVVEISVDETVGDLGV